MARRGQRQPGARRPAPRQQQRARPATTRASSPCSPARCARSRRPSSADRCRRRCARSSRSSPCWCARSAPGSSADRTSSEAHRAKELKRLDGIAADPGQDRGPRHLAARPARRGRRRLRRGQVAARRHAARRPASSPPPEEVAPTGARPSPRPPPSVASCRSRSSPASSPTPSSPPTSPPPPAQAAAPRRLAGWELLGPLFQLLRAGRRRGLGVHGAARAGVPARAGRPGADAAPGAAGRRRRRRATGPSCSPTSPAWARRRRRCSPRRRRTPTRCWSSCRTSSRPTGRARPSLWTPNRPATVIHGDGDTIDGFADIVIVNYEVLDRHVGLARRPRLPRHGRRRGALHQEQVLAALAARAGAVRAHPVRAPPRPLLMALTGTPLINDIEDFRAIWQFLGWIDDKKPLRRADARARGDRPDAGRPRVLPGRAPVRDRPRHRPAPQGRRRRRHPGPPHRRPAGRARRQGRPLDPQGRARAGPPHGGALRERARDPRRPVRRSTGIDHDLVRQVATWERKDTATKKTGENVFSMMRRIGQAKAGPGRRLRRAAGPQRRQGRLLRQAHRRDGRRRGDLRPARASGTPRSAATRRTTVRQKQHRRLRQRPRRRTSRSAR